jgi:hypothetical protein
MRARLGGHRERMTCYDMTKLMTTTCVLCQMWRTRGVAKRLRGYEAGDVHSTKERGCMSPGCWGMCALSGWLGGSHGKVESGFLFVSRVQTGGKGKSQDWQSQSGTFQFARPSRFHHTHKHVEFITKQRIRHHHLRQYLLARLMHCCCWICCISGRRNGRRFCLSCLEVDVCARGGDRRSRSVRSCLTRSSSQTGRLGRFDAFL